MVAIAVMAAGHVLEGRYCTGGIPACLTTFPHFSTSDATYAENCSGVLPTVRRRMPKVDGLMHAPAGDWDHLVSVAHNLADQLLERDFS